ncbi:hypothetical protein ACWGJ9_11690 [Curtobacterium citreum]
MPAPLQELHDRVVRDLLAYDAAPQTEHLKAVAESVVAARQHFTTGDGTPDWKGRTNAYRTWSRGAYTEGRADTTTAAAIRYHVSAEIRRVLGADEVAELGLVERDARGRSATHTDRRRSQLALVTGGGPLTDPADVAALLTQMTSLLKRIDPAAISDGPHREVRPVLAGLDDVITEATRVRNAI